MSKKFFAILSAAITSVVGYPAVYEINAPVEWDNNAPVCLKMGGRSAYGDSIGVNSMYVSRNGVPVIPVMGEFHYCRYPAGQWEQEIQKMKAGGINLLSTYVFWNLHEEKEGVWNWYGNLDLRSFLKLCKKNNMEVVIRIGPFGHGEIRSGGLPDWIFAKNLDVRSNDAAYLRYVEKFYSQIAGQISGYLFKDGGPVIGCQIENEHQHSAAPWYVSYPGEKTRDHTAASYDKGITKVGVSVQDAKITRAELGTKHMQTLLQMAKNAGIITPLYTATGWGNAAVIPGEAIPVTAGYTYPTWSAKQRRSNFCIFKDLRKQPDYSPVRYDPAAYPSASAEMGVGIQIVYDRRPICQPDVAEAMMIRCLGGGSNIIGYYMYHGGSTPCMNNGTGDFFSDQPMGVPKISYDFQAPLGEFGLEAPSFRLLRTIHSFLDDFGDRLAPMVTVMPDNASFMTPDNCNDLRYAARMNSRGEGFLFLVNSQDHDSDRHDQTGLQIKLNIEGDTVMVPGNGGFTLPKNTSAILPFNFDMDGACLKYAIAQPLMKIEDNGSRHYFFFVRPGMKPEYLFDKTTVKGRYKFNNITPGFNSTFQVKTNNGKTIKITTLAYNEALNATKINGKLLITKATVVPQPHGARLLSMGNPEFEYVVYPSVSGFKKQVSKVTEVEPEFAIDRSVPLRMEVSFKMPDRSENVNEYFLSVPYIGDVAMAFIDGEMVLDNFWQGRPWIIGLDRFSNKIQQGKPMGFYFRPLRKDVPYLKDIPEKFIPDLSGSPVLEIGKVDIIPQYAVEIDI